MKKNVKVNGDGIGFLGALFLIFLTLKLCKVITWSWWFIFMPIYLLPAIVISVFFVVVILAACADVMKSIFKKKEANDGE